MIKARKKVLLLSMLGITTFVLISFKCMSLKLSKAFSEESTFLIKIHCQNSPIKTYIPSIGYTIQMNTSTHSPTCLANAQLTSMINYDSDPSVFCDPSNGQYITLQHVTPKMKIVGLQCFRANKLMLGVNGSGFDNPNLDIAIQSLSQTQWREKQRVDHLNPSSMITLFGPNGRILRNYLVDGADDDGIRNGDIVVGHQTATGASKTFVKIFLNGFRDQKTLTESLNFTFMPK